MKRFVISTLTAAALLLSTAAPALASASQVSATPFTAEQAQARGEAIDPEQANVSQFKDWNDSAWWAKSGGMKYAIAMGYIVGREGPTVAAEEPVSEAEFVTVLVRTCLSDDDIAKYKAQALEEYKQEQLVWADYYGNAAPSDQEIEYSFNHGGVNWYVASGCYNAGVALGIVRGAMDSEGAAERVCTRADMATLLVRTMKARGEDVDSIDSGKACGVMNDRALYTFSSEKYAGYGDAIGAVIGAGLIVGDQNRNFNPGATMTRGEMTEVILRLDNPKTNGSYPRESALAQLGFTETPTVSQSIVVDTEEPITIDMRTPTVAHRAPKEGDTVIRPDGTSVVLERDEVTGVLGYGQNVGPYLGTESKENGHLITTGEWYMAGGSNGTWTDPLAGGWYMQSPVEGQEYTYHWSSEWSEIKNATYPEYQGTDGQLDSTGLWLWDDGGWCWCGPDNC